MGLKDFMNKYVISIGPGSPASGSGDLSQVTLQAQEKVAPSVSPVDEEALKALPGSGTSFEKIFETAQVPVPGHGFTVEKVAEMLQNPRLANASREARAAAVLVALEAQGVKVEEIIQDAVRKDKALDVFEKVQTQHFQKRREEALAENTKISAAIDDFVRGKKIEIENNTQTVVRLESSLKGWLSRKEKKERELFDVVQYFTSENPITVLSLPSDTPSVKVTDLTGSLKKSNSSSDS